MNYHIAICDDEQEYINKVEFIVKEYFQNSNNTYQLYKYLNGKNLLKDISMFNIIFLDIQLKNINGLDIKNKLSKYHDLRIIFVTNYEQYMQEAYGRNVIAYIKKTEIYKIHNILKTIENEDYEHQFIILDGRTIDTIDILYIQAEGAYCRIYLHYSDTIISIYLKDLLNKLNSFFIRVHRSYIVNIRYIKDIQKNKIILSNEKVIPISPTYKENTTKAYYDYVRGSFL